MKSEGVFEDGGTDCHSQFENWPRNDREFYMGCGGAGDREGRPYA